MLTPSERYNEIIKIVSGIFILYTLMTPIKGLLNSAVYEFEIPEIVSDNSGDYAVYEENSKKIFDEALYSAVADSIESDLRCSYKELKKTNVIAKADDGEFKIVVSGIPSEKHNEIYSYIKSGFDIEPIITE